MKKESISFLSYLLNSNIRGESTSLIMGDSGEPHKDANASQNG